MHLLEAYHLIPASFMQLNQGFLHSCRSISAYPCVSLQYINTLLQHLRVPLHLSNRYWSISMHPCTSLVTPGAPWRISASSPAASHGIPAIDCILMCCISANTSYHLLGIVVLHDAMVHRWRHGDNTIASPSYPCTATGRHFCIGPYSN